MRENKIIPISTKLPRGIKAEYARKYKLSNTAIKMICDGHLDKPEIYAELLKEALAETKRRKVETNLREKNSRMAKKI